MAMTLELDFTGMTWGELRKFVALGAQLADDEPVDFGTSPYDDDVCALRITNVEVGRHR